MVRFLVPVLLALTLPGGAQANVIETACRGLDTPKATVKRCRCVGEVAEEKLMAGDLRKVATWFENPDRAQVVRQSDRRRDEALWERYKAFGDAAARSCG